MCGIFGYAGFESDEYLLRRMANVVNARGPDDEGFLMGDRVGLGMRRLSIIDVSHGHQPVFNKDKTLTIFLMERSITTKISLKSFKARVMNSVLILIPRPFFTFLKNMAPSA